MRVRRSIQEWHGIRNTQLYVDAHSFWGNGVGAMATLRTAALNLLRLAGFQSIRAGIQAVKHYITMLLVMAQSQPQCNYGETLNQPCSAQSSKRSWRRVLETPIDNGILGLIQ